MSKHFALFLFSLTPFNTFTSEPPSSPKLRLVRRPSPILTPRCVSQSNEGKKKSISPLSLSPEHKSPAQQLSPKNIPIAPSLPAQNSAPRHRKQSSKTLSL